MKLQIDKTDKLWGPHILSHRGCHVIYYVTYYVSEIVTPSLLVQQVSQGYSAEKTLDSAFANPSLLT